MENTSKKIKSSPINQIDEVKEKVFKAIDYKIMKSDSYEDNAALRWLRSGGEWAIKQEGLLNQDKPVYKASEGDLVAITKISNSQKYNNENAMYLAETLETWATYFNGVVADVEQGQKASKAIEKFIQSDIYQSTI